MVIDNNLFVAVSYTLIVGENDGNATVMETAPKDKPFVFTFGLGMVLPKFEENLKGKAVGDAFNFTLTPEEAYGDFEEGRVVELSLDIFKNDKGEIDSPQVAVDHTLQMMDAEGNTMLGTITAINGDKVTMDFNHPLAGEHLHFVGEVIEVREATAEEMAAAISMHQGGCGGGGCHGCHGCGSEGEGGCGGHGKEGGCCGKHKES